MKITQAKLKFLVALFVMVAGFMMINSKSALAAAKTWTGTAGDNKLATASNWQGGSAPVDGDSLVFGASDQTLTLTNDLSSSITINGIATQRAVVFGGASLKISGTISGSGNGYIDFDENVTIADDLSITLGTITFSKNISGSGNLSHTYSGGQYDGELRLNGNNSSFTGSITTQGVYVCAQASAGTFGASSAPTSITDGGLVFQKTTSSVSIAEPLTLSNTTFGTSTGSCGIGGGGAPSKISSVVTLTGSVTATGTVKFNSLGDVTISNALASGTIQIQNGSLGNLTIAGQVNQAAQDVQTIDTTQKCADLYSSNTVGRNSKYIVNVNCGTKAFWVGGVLMGSGSVGELTIQSGGVVAPGNSPGILSSGNLLFEEGGIYQFEMAGNNSGEYDQINVTGTVTLDNGTLQVSLLNDFKPEQGKSFVIINNDGSDAVNGNFAGLSEGATVEVDGVGYFTISYTGGDGNDVVLTAIPGVANTGDFKKSANLGFLIGGALAIGVVAVKSKKLILKRR